MSSLVVCHHTLIVHTSKGISTASKLRKNTPIYIDNPPWLKGITTSVPHTAETGTGGELSSILMSSVYSSYFMKQSKDAHETTTFFCVGCKEKGLGKCYRFLDAENGDYHLHQQCYDLSQSGYSSSIKFAFLDNKKCDFVFQKGAPGGGDQSQRRACDACGKDVKGWSYQCRICKKPHYLHPCCAHLPIKQEGEGGIVLYLKAKTSSKCLECKRENISQGLRGWFYVSNCGKHCYHVACVMDMALENLEKGGGWCDDDPYPIKETADHGRKSCSCESLTRARSRAITKRSRKVEMKKVLTWATKLVLNLIISAIFGIPINSACDAFYDLF